MTKQNVPGFAASPGKLTKTAVEKENINYPEKLAIFVIVIQLLS
jgi:hypothetical protein